MTTTMNDRKLARNSSLSIPKGTLISSYTPKGRETKPAGRALNVVVHSVIASHVVLWDDDPKHIPGTVRLAQITWAGSGGYWRTAQVTAAVAEANGLPFEVPSLDPHQQRYLSHYGVSPDDVSMSLTDEWHGD